MVELARWFWIVAGINGAGKTTIVSAANLPFIAHMPSLNPDAHTKEILLENPQLALDAANRLAADEVDAQVRRHIDAGESFVVETVLSSDKYKPLLERSLANVFKVGMIYVALSSPELAILRVRDRVAGGGHDVPEDKIRQSWGRSLDNMAWFAGRVHRLLVFCNDHPHGRPILIAEGFRGRILIREPDVLPDVTSRLRSVGGIDQRPD